MKILKFSIISLLVAIVASISIFTFLNLSEETKAYEDITTSQYTEKINDGDSFFVYFYSPQCAYCKKASPLLNRKLKNSHIACYGIDTSVEENKDHALFNSINLNEIPALIKYENGKEVKRIISDLSQKDIDNFFEN